MNSPSRPNVINRALFAVRTLDSSALTIRGAIYHRFAGPGDYEVFVSREGRLIHREHVGVSVDAGASQIDVDLGKPAEEAKCNCGGRGGSGRKIRVGGVMAFYATRGVGVYTVRIDHWTDKARTTVLDSAKQLSPGDLFSAILVVPGTYRVHVDDAVFTEVRVSTPEPKKPYRPDEPVLLSPGSHKEKESATFDLQAGRTIVLLLEKGGRVRVEPVKVEDQSS
jgi:hypothetical protein